MQVLYTMTITPIALTAMKLIMRMNMMTSQLSEMQYNLESSP
jgi:hypothetical protein